MTGYLLPLIAAALTAAAVLVIAMFLIEWHQRAGMRRSLALVLRIGAINASDEELAIAPSTSITSALLSGMAERLVTARSRNRLREHLAWGGRPMLQDLLQVMERKIIYGIIGLCMGFMIAMLFGGAWWLLLIAGPILGFYLPDLLVYNAALHRTEEVLLTLPDALDLLDLCVESGLSLQAGLGRVSQHQTGPVADEFGRVLHEMQLGVSRADAFDAMARRTRQEDLQRFVSAILQADKLGIPIANVLKEQARDMRSRRQSRAREQAQKVPVKILAPLMLCLMPGLFIIILGPAIISSLGFFLGR